MARKRLRELGITIGELPVGPHNAITDIPGVLVGQCTLIEDAPRVARTGITMILPRGEQSWQNYSFAGFHALNGNGEMTGVHWLAETGLLCSPIGLTNTYQVGMVRDAIVEYAAAHSFPETENSSLPVVAETHDGWLNDINAFHLAKSHAFEALENARSGEVEEGNVGGGTGMICHEFKGGIGTSSRIVSGPDREYKLGVLVQANYGDRGSLRVGGVPVGKLISTEDYPTPWPEPPQGSSIIGIIATDAPLLPIQCRRLAQRATIGLARVGGVGNNDSGDIFLAFSTGNGLHDKQESPQLISMVANHNLDPLFEAVAEAMEEAILNALTAAETLTGFQGHIAHELPLKKLEEIFSRYKW
jgi:D-aminopeptidase